MVASYRPTLDSSCSDRHAADTIRRHRCKSPGPPDVPKPNVCFRTGTLRRRGGEEITVSKFWPDSAGDARFAGGFSGRSGRRPEPRCRQVARADFCRHLFRLPSPRARTQEAQRQLPALPLHDRTGRGGRDGELPGGDSGRSARKPAKEAVGRGLDAGRDHSIAPPGAAKGAAEGSGQNAAGAHGHQQRPPAGKRRGKSARRRRRCARGPAQPAGTDARARGSPPPPPPPLEAFEE